jgi:hypothetical protein
MMQSTSIQNLLRNSLYSGLHKNKNAISFVDLKYTYLDLDICQFYVAQNTKYLGMFFAYLWNK